MLIVALRHSTGGILRVGLTEAEGVIVAGSRLSEAPRWGGFADFADAIDRLYGQIAKDGGYQPPIASTVLVDGGAAPSLLQWSSAVCPSERSQWWAVAARLRAVAAGDWRACLAGEAGHLTRVPDFAPIPLSLPPL